ncbi:hypothetical protein HN511_00170 [bacterium]|nr:hypothetical protein [bacterium]
MFFKIMAYRESADQVGVYSFSKISPWHLKNQDYFVAGPGYMAVMDGVSAPSSDNAARIVGEAIQKGRQDFQGFMSRAEVDAKTKEGRDQIIEFLYGVMAHAKEALDNHNNANNPLGRRDRDEATTAVLTTVVKGSDKEYYLFSLNAGDSESVVYREAEQIIERLNPFMHYTLDIEPNLQIEFDGQKVNGWRFGMDGEILPDRLDRDMADPGNCLQTRYDCELVVTVTQVLPDDWIITSSDGLGDNVSYEELEKFSKVSANPQELVTVLSTLKQKRKEDDVTVVVARVGDL